MSTILQNEGPLRQDLLDVTQDDEAIAREAFDRLWSVVRASLLKRAGRVGLEGDDAQDLVQRAAAYLWEHRRSFHPSALAEWQALAHRALRRCLSSEWRARSRERTIQREAQIPAGDAPYLDALVSQADEVRRIYEAADRLWLGRVRGGRDDVAAAAVQQVLLMGLSEARAASMFGATEAEAAGWMNDPAALARALFGSLCWPGEDLAGYVLRPERPLAPQELDELSESNSPEAWPGLEARAIVWRARNGLSEGEILALVRSSLGPEDVAALMERFRGALPFRRIADALLLALEARGMAAEMSRPGLWRRIAFEYAAGHQLPHAQIAERADAAARVAGRRVDVATLNNWLTLRRLYAQLAATMGSEA